jgi:antitoxin VapB
MVYTPGITMSKPESGIAKVFKHGRSQAVRIPAAFRLTGNKVRIRRVPQGLLLEPFEQDFDLEAWFARLDQFQDIEFMEDGRNQPPMPEPDPDELFD